MISGDNDTDYYKVEYAKCMCGYDYLDEYIHNKDIEYKWDAENNRCNMLNSTDGSLISTS